MNQLRIRAKAVAKSALRYTPSGVAVLEASFRHEGNVTEAAMQRTLAFEFSAIALGPVAQSLAREALGTTVILEGFIAPRSRRTTRLLVHVTEYKINE
ncbi:MAG TPA: primosomal replication protein N [Burkholderiaceae bacterium]|nr:primosomal replication protein N [Burkholderiaceae bacterium]